MSLDRRRQMIEADHPRLSVARQCALVSISRSAFSDRPAGETPLNLALMRRIDEVFLEHRGTAHGRWHATYAVKATRSGATACGG